MLSFLDIFFPKRCVGCNKVGEYFCGSCKNNILQTDLVCPKCERLAFGGVVHPICIRKYGLDGFWSLGVYQNPLKKAIKKLKYRRVLGYADALMDITIEYWARFQPVIFEQIKKEGGENFLVVPVPLHERRKRWRGFNQSEELARALAQKLGLDFADCLIRTRYTTPQANLKGSSRYKNIKNAFSLNTKCDIRNTSIILVDDVWTTGSTLRECTFVLKRGGAKKVWGLTIAR